MHLHEQLPSRLKQRKRNRKCQQRNSKYKKKNQRKTLELKSMIGIIQNSLNRVNIRIEDTDKRISKLEDKLIEITQSEQQRENRQKKKKKKEKDRTSGTCGTKIEALTFMFLESKRKQRKSGG